jgi:hypothetical protein
MARSFDAMAAHTFQAMNKATILGDGEPEPLQPVQASYQLFPRSHPWPSREPAVPLVLS